jgi:hypothetical protein
MGANIVRAFVFKAERTASLPVIFCHFVGILVLQGGEPGPAFFASRRNEKLSVVSGMELSGFPET